MPISGKKYIIPHNRQDERYANRSHYERHDVTIVERSIPMKEFPWNSNLFPRMRLRSRNLLIWSEWRDSVTMTSRIDIDQWNHSWSIPEKIRSIVHERSRGWRRMVNAMRERIIAKRKLRDERDDNAFVHSWRWDCSGTMNHDPVTWKLSTK